MSDLAVQNRESEQEVMPSFDFLLERETERNTLLAEHRAEEGNQQTLAGLR